MILWRAIQQQSNNNPVKYNLIFSTLWTVQTGLKNAFSSENPSTVVKYFLQVLETLTHFGSCTVPLLFYKLNIFSYLAEKEGQGDTIILRTPFPPPLRYDPVHFSYTLANWRRHLSWWSRAHPWGTAGGSTILKSHWGFKLWSKWNSGQIIFYF